jgi:hypothetical protein
MHAYVYAMQMQCNYGAKHLKCYNIALSLQREPLDQTNLRNGGDTS